MNTATIQKTILGLTAGILVLAVLAGWLLLAPQKAEPLAETGNTLSARTLADVQRVEVTNSHGSYSVWQEGGGFILHDLPPERVNGEYLQMLLEECAAVTYTEELDGEDDLAAYGLLEPEARVEIEYTDGESLTLLLGAEEPMGGGRYFTTGDDSTIRVMKANRTIRFFLPVTGFISYYIGPGLWASSPLSIIEDITFSGEAFPQPVVITAVHSESEAEMREASSFGVATHLVRSPGLHEINQTTAVDAFGSLLGLLSDGIVDYNCDADALADYGFDAPWMNIDYTYLATKEGPSIAATLRIAQWEGGYIANHAGEGIVYRIRGDEAFLGASYEDLVMRWLLTPFITDLTRVELEVYGEGHEFTFTGEDNQSLAVALDGEDLDIELFRKFYSLLVSASWEGDLQENPALPENAEMAVTFHYRDGEKPADTLRLYRATDRTLYVEVNGVCEFTMREKYLITLQAALAALANGQDFTSEW